MTTLETVLGLMNLPLSRFSGVVRTSDGHYLARSRGDIGYNHFLGRPAPLHDGPGRTNMLKVWSGLTDEQKAAALLYALIPPDGCPLLLHEDFGVPRFGSSMRPA